MRGRIPPGAFAHPSSGHIPARPPPSSCDVLDLLERNQPVALVEHHGGNDDPADPDFEGGGSNPTTYNAIRISAAHLPGFSSPVEAVYVEYQDRAHEIEYYDIAADPFEQRNIANELTTAPRTQLHKILVGLEGCHTGAACWSAASPS